MTDTVYTTENWAEMINAMHSGAVIEIGEDVFYYFLEVLPPVYMARVMDIGGQRRRVLFGFAEGSEPITAFWSEGLRTHQRFYCQRTAEVNRG